MERWEIFRLGLRVPRGGNQFAKPAAASSIAPMPRIEGLRSPYDKTIGGLHHLGRMCDKIRLRHAGKLPEHGPRLQPDDGAEREAEDDGEREAADEDGVKRAEPARRTGDRGDRGRESENGEVGELADAAEGIHDSAFAADHVQ